MRNLFLAAMQSARRTRRRRKLFLRASPVACVDSLQVADDGLRIPVKSTAKTVDEYVKSLPEDRREAIGALRKVILDNLPKGYQECMNYGMIGYVVPHSIYPKGHHGDPKLPLPFVNLGSKKNDMALHLMWVDAKTDQWFRKAWEKTGRKLDGGKRLERGENVFAVGCIRFKRLEDVPLEVVGELIARTPVADYIARIESVFDSRAAKSGKSKGLVQEANRKQKGKGSEETLAA